MFAQVVAMQKFLQFASQNAQLSFTKEGVWLHAHVLPDPPRLAANAPTLHVGNFPHEGEA